MPLNSPRMRVLVDWDGDGYLNKGVGPTTPLNAAVFPITLGPGSGYDMLRPNTAFWFNGTVYTATYGAVSNKVHPTYSPTPYGLWSIKTTFPLSTRIQMGGAGDGGGINTMHFGQVPINTSTLQFWARRTSGSGGNFTAFLVDGSGSTNNTTYLGQTTFDVGTAWQLVIVDINNIYGTAKNTFLRIDKNSGTGEWEFTGFNLLKGAAYPTYQPFNVGTTLARYDDLETYQISADWDLGMAAPEDMVAAEGRLTVELNNTAKVFSVENPLSPFYVSTVNGRVVTNFKEGVMVVVEVLNDTDGVWYPFWQGFLSALDIKTVPNPTATIVAEQGIFRFDSVPPVFPVLENNTADGIIKTLANSGWVIGSNSNAAIVSKTSLKDSTVMAVVTNLNTSGIDVGAVQYAYAGEDWRSGSVRASEIISDLMAAERGLFFIARDGTIKFYNRDRIYSDGAAFGSFTAVSDADITACTYVYKSGPYNAVKVDYYPKEKVVGQIWTSREPIYVEPTATKDTTVNFENLEGGKATVISINPFSGSNPSTVTVLDEAKAAYSTSAFVIETIVNNGEAVIRINNFSSTGLYFNITLWGVTLLSYGGRSVTVTASNEQQFVGAKVMSLSSKLITTEAQARMLGGVIAAEFKSNYGTFTKMSISSRNAAWLDRMRSLTLGSRVNLSETNSGVSHKVMIVGEHFRWSSGILEVDYTLRPCDNVRFWTLDETPNNLQELAY